MLLRQFISIFVSMLVASSFEPLNLSVYECHYALQTTEKCVHAVTFPLSTFQHNCDLFVSGFL